MIEITFIPQELHAIREALISMINDGFAEQGDSDPIVTALLKVGIGIKQQEERNK